MVTDKQCVHFDMGGERFPARALLTTYCKKKANILALSHLDADHVRFIRKAGRFLKLCLLDKGSFPKNKFTPRLPLCSTMPSHLKLLHRSSFRLRNESHIYIWKNLVLVPGDAYKKQELGLLSSRDILSIRFLLVGHHGSKTSSHEHFVRKLKNLEQAIVSARRSKYGHPHAHTTATFRRLKAPVITTEDFGTLIYEL